MSIAKLAIRPASSDDIGQLVRLNGIVQQRHVEMEPSRFKVDPGAEAVAAFFRAAMSFPQNTIVLAQRGADSVGYLWFERQDRPGTALTHPRIRFYIHHVVVEPRARRAGVASALLCYVETAARNAGVRSIALDTWSANAEALAFFAAQGYASVNVVLEKAV